jgi:hypothetical protein
MSFKRFYKVFQGVGIFIVLSSFYFSPVNADVLKACLEPAIWPNFHNCYGSYTWKDGNKYVGEWQLGKMHGHGTYTYPKKYKYVGEWKEAKIDGYGTHTWSDGTKYVGMWKNRKANGRGVLTKPNGKSLEGFWEKGRLLIKEKRTVYEADLIPPTPDSLNNLSPSDD